MTEINIPSILIEYIKNQQQILDLSSYLNYLHTLPNRERDSAWQKIVQEFPRANKKEFEILWKILPLLGTFAFDKKQEQTAQKKLRTIIQKNPSLYSLKYIETVARSADAPRFDRQRSLNSDHVNMISDFELFVADLFKILYDQHKENISFANQYTWEEIIEHSSIEEFKAHALEKYLLDRMYKSYPEYLEIFGKFHSDFKNAKPQSLDPIFSSVESIEIFQRRNVIIHNGAEASEKYIKVLKGIDSKFSTTPKTKLNVSSEYLNKSADRLLLIAFALVMKVARNCYSQDKNMQDRIDHVYWHHSFLFLREKRYDLVYQMYKSTFLYEDMEEENKNVIKVNGWLASQKLGLFDAQEQAALNSWQPNPDDHLSTLAKTILQGNFKDMADQIEAMLQSDEISIFDLATWPLFEMLQIDLADFTDL